MKIKCGCGKKFSDKKKYLDHLIKGEPKKLEGISEKKYLEILKTFKRLHSTFSYIGELRTVSEIIGI